MRVLTLADLFVKLVLQPISAPQHPEENDNEGQQDEDKVKKTHDGADDGADDGGDDGAGPGGELEQPREQDWM